eukprot:665305-Lingulodinium_polyedra.AAC.1
MVGLEFDDGGGGDADPLALVAHPAPRSHGKRPAQPSSSQRQQSRVLPLFPGQPHQAPPFARRAGP